jgi:hypothetical protein
MQVADGRHRQVRFFNLVDVNATTLEASSCDWTVFVEQVCGECADALSQRDSWAQHGVRVGIGVGGQLSDARSLLPMRLRLVYNSVLYSSERIDEVLRQIEMILDECLSNPDLAVADVSVRRVAAVAVACLAHRADTCVCVLCLSTAGDDVRGASAAQSGPAT